MVMRCILVPLAADLDPSPALDAAGRLARRLRAHVTVAYLAPTVEQVLAPLAGLPASSLTVSAIKEGQRLAAAQARERVAAWCGREGIPLADAPERLDATFLRWTEVEGDADHALTMLGRIHDLVVVGRPRAGTPFTEAAFDTALFAVGRPVLMVGEAVPDDLLRHVVIAWNGSLEATHLVAQSIALLHEADRVTVIEAETARSGETRLADLGAYLHWHGIQADSARVRLAPGETEGEGILAEAARRGATLLAMGAFTHSRVRQLLLGGVTRHVVARAEIPVLMAH
ncbi:UspA domain protein [Methylobacterium sp. 4-46]|uniref:universal stress protein n=1 Tax=unclassified Methylobacterium TaxID=2615210 RepID=UPI000152DA3C|nr:MULTISPECIES: universal stress protein [Methylobacterium]ACA14664.1 UspA domain protein [Methylobacterium sp. 4-46]WFT80418.1 universal stress protein [Methylobacterium nodulans]